MKTRAILLGLALLVFGIAGLLYLVLPSSGPHEGPRDAPQGSRPTEERAATGHASDPNPAEEASTGQDRGAICGRVLLESPREPIAGAHVAAIGEDSASYAAEAVTDDQGRYALSGLAPGRYRVCAWRGELTMRQVPRGRQWIDLLPGARVEGVDLILRAGAILTGTVVEEFTERPIPAATVCVDWVRFGATDQEGRFRIEGMRAGVVCVWACAGGFTSRTLIAGIDPGVESSILIELAPGGVIEGVVTMPTGEPAAGAKVTSSSRFSSLARTKTDEAGRYRLDGIPCNVGGVTVSAALEGLHAWRSAPSFAEAGTHASLDLHLEPVERPPDLVLVGRVMDATGGPVAGAEIVYRHPPRITTSDADGAFRLDVPSDPRWALCARRDGHAPASIRIEEIPPEGREGIEFVLGPGHFVAGIVVIADGTPVEGACVTVETQRQYPGCAFEAQTDPDGRFRIQDLPMDLTKITASKEDIGSGASSAKPDAEDVRIVLEEPAQINGIVLEQGTGSPVRRFHVLRTRPDPRMHGSDFIVRFPETHTHDTGGVQYGAGDGRFIIRGVQPGKGHVLIVVAKGYMPQVAEGVEACPASMAADPVRIEMVAGLTLTGRVIVAGTGEAVEGARVIHYLAPGGPAASSGGYEEFALKRNTITDAEGRFRLRDLTDIPGCLHIEKRGFAGVTYSGVGPSSEWRVFALSPAATIEGVVTTAAGDPLLEASVAVAAGGRFLRAATDLQGRYHIDGVPSGQATVTIEGTRELRGGWTRTMTLLPRETTVVDFSIGLGAISGRVTHGGEPAPEAWVEVRAEGYDHARAAGPDGAFRVEGLTPGEYKVSARRSGSTPHAPRSVVSLRVDACEVECEIPLPDATLIGTVIDAETRRPIEGANVEARRREDGAFGSAATSGWRGGLGSTRSDASGRFEIRELMEGVYTLAARARDGVEGFLGPLRVDPSARYTDLVIPLGGTGSTIRVFDGRTGGPIADAWVGLETEDGSWTGSRVMTDQTGTATLRAATGRYLMKAGATGHLPAMRVVNIEPDTAPITVPLDPAASMVVILEGRWAQEQEHTVSARIVRGDQPGWLSDIDVARSPGNDTASPSNASGRVRFDIRPGGYRVSFCVRRVWSRPYRSEVALERELDVTVPEDGEAVVRLKLPGW